LLPVTYQIDPELAEFVALFPVRDWNDPVAARTALDDLISEMNASVDTTGVTIEDRSVPGHENAPEVPVRIYSPANRTSAVPGLLDIHGGGFAVGSIEMEHAVASRLVIALGIVVVAVDYRLAPENPFPAGLEDCYAALRWMRAEAATLGIDPERIGAYGQSAGGGLTAALALLARDRGGPQLCFQFLGIPELDDRLDTPSMQQFVDTPVWHRGNAILSWKYYLGDGHTDEVSPYAAPARATDLSGLPPAYVSTMEFDPLRDEGIIYALRLLQAGVPVELHQYPGTFHGSALIPTAGVSRRSAAEMVEVLRRGLRVTGPSVLLEKEKVSR
jgi:acetyl esterase/lipase